MALAVAPRTRLALALLALLTLPRLARGQGALNLGFEEPSLVHPTLPDGWAVGGAADAARDSAIAHSGRWSVRIRHPASGVTALNATLSAAVVRGHTVRLSAFIRTDSLVGGQAVPWLRAFRAGRMLLPANAMEPGATGTRDWTRFTVELRVDSAADAVAFGVVCAGRGTAWVDDLEVEVDGRPYATLLPPPWAPTATETAWLRHHASAFLADRPGSGLTDLERLHPLVAGARVVALGEQTHGTAEFFRMKHRLLEYLVGREGFTLFAIEDDMAGAHAVNDYVLEGKGTAREALAHLRADIWHTRELLDLITWLRAYNASGQGRVEFWGVDAQTPWEERQAVRAFVGRADPAYLPVVDSAWARARAAESDYFRTFAPTAQAQEAQRAAAAVLAHLEADRESLAQRTSAADVDWAIQCARQAVQGVGLLLDGGASRDSAMAENAAWILAHRPGAKLVLWAHNIHVQRAPRAMGGYLDRRFGSALRVFGMAFGTGSYDASEPVYDRLPDHRAYAAGAPAEGSFEAAFHRLGVPRFVLDLRPAATESSAAWLKAPHRFRAIGFAPVDVSRAFQEQPLWPNFDALVYFDVTTPAHPLSRSLETP